MEQGFKLSVDDIKQNLIICGDTTLFEKIELASCSSLELVNKIKKICKRINTTPQI